MPSLKYQIFISSTHDDLVNQRRQVIEACLSMGHIPLGMEMFTTTDEQQWEIIKKCIDESDYYVVIIAHRYGSIIDGISWTEREYDYAIQRGVPVLAFVIDDKASWPNDLIDNVAAAKKLRTFKSKVRQKPVSFWESDTDLIAKSAIALGKVINTIPRSGWVRGSSVPGPEVAEEIARLSSENAGLRSELERIRSVQDKSRFAQGDDPFTFSCSCVGLERSSVKTTWRELFLNIADSLIDVSHGPHVIQRLLRFYGKLTDRPITTIASVQIDPADLRSIKAQFIALDLLSFDGDVWTLTTEGKRIYSEHAAEKRQIA